MQLDAVKVNSVVAPKPKIFTMQGRLASDELILSVEIRREKAVVITSEDRVM